MIEDLKSALAKALSLQAYGALQALPGFGFIFGLPVIRNVVQFILDKSAAWLVQETSVGLSILWIQVDMAYEIASAEDAREKLKAMLYDPKAYTEKEQKQIEAHFDQTTIDLISLELKRLA